MSQVFFITFLIALSVIRLPLSLLVVVLRPLVPFFKKRLNFERKNLIEASSLPFSLEKKRADYCFEVSSEGELEQVRPLLEAVLMAQKKIEIIFSSPSVEEKCLKLFEKHPHQIRLFRLPLLSASPFNLLYFQSVGQWVSAPVVIFCRYDFFPELLLLKIFNKKLILVSAALKKMSWYKRMSFFMFDVVVAATDKEKNQFKALLPQTTLYSCDFRVPRIANRYEHAQETLVKKAHIHSYLEKLQTISMNDKIILGSAWKSDLDILNDRELITKVKAKGLYFLIAPHKLDDDFVEELRLQCASFFGSDLVEVVNNDQAYKGSPVVILQMSGILCELYSLFKYAYVGGGYERSIHSVLEPLFSNNFVVMGPKTSRSTEFDMALDLAPDEIHVLKGPESFYTIIKSWEFKSVDLNRRKAFLETTKTTMNTLLKELLK